MAWRPRRPPRRAWTQPPPTPLRRPQSAPPPWGPTRSIAACRDDNVAAYASRPAPAQGMAWQKLCPCTACRTQALIMPSCACIQQRATEHQSFPNMSCTCTTKERAWAIETATEQLPFTKMFFTLASDPLPFVVSVQRTSSSSHHMRGQDKQLQARPATWCLLIGPPLQRETERQIDARWRPQVSRAMCASK